MKANNNIYRTFEAAIKGTRSKINTLMADNEISNVVRVATQEAVSALAKTGLITLITVSDKKVSIDITERDGDGKAMTHIGFDVTSCDAWVCGGKPELAKDCDNSLEIENLTIEALETPDIDRLRGFLELCKAVDKTVVECRVINEEDETYKPKATNVCYQW